jgi:hypothetical protein
MITTRKKSSIWREFEKEKKKKKKKETQNVRSILRFPEDCKNAM